MKIKSKFEYWKSDKTKDWYWHFKAGNGRIKADGGEGYKRKLTMLKAINKFATEVILADVVEKK